MIINRFKQNTLFILPLLGVVVLSSAMFIFSLPAFASGNRAITKYHPVVLVHGVSRKGAKLFIGPVPLGDYFYKIPALLRRRLPSLRVEVPDLPTDASIDERAALLNTYLQKKFKDQKVHIIAHSIGGLVARYTVSELKNTNIISISTIGTPHRGTPLADWAVEQMEQDTIFYELIKFFGQDFKGWRFLPQITLEAMNNFNNRVLNSYNVEYFSVVSAVEEGAYMSWPMRVSEYFLRKKMPINSSGPTDGVVPGSSQSWGKVIKRVNYDHVAQVNHHLRISPDFSRFQEDVGALYYEIYNNANKNVISTWAN